MNITAQETPSMSKTLCFLFSGKAGVGKTYCSDMMARLTDEAGLTHFKSLFAYGVKRTAKCMGWDGQKDDKGRHLLQEIGKLGRLYDPDLWAKSAFSFIENSDGYPYDCVFIDDWRFKNEYHYIGMNQPLYKVVPIRVHAPDREMLRGKVYYADISETELDSFPWFRYIVYNNLDARALEEYLKKILSLEINSNISK
jgi:hypothetical protein